MVEFITRLARPLRNVAEVVLIAGLLVITDHDEYGTRLSKRRPRSMIASFERLLPPMEREMLVVNNTHCVLVTSTYERQLTRSQADIILANWRITAQRDGPQAIRYEEVPTT